jgi:hypothetical protein
MWGLYASLFTARRLFGTLQILQFDSGFKWASSILMDSSHVLSAGTWFVMWSWSMRPNDWNKSTLAKDKNWKFLSNYDYPRRKKPPWLKFLLPGKICVPQVWSCRRLLIRLWVHCIFIVCLSSSKLVWKIEMTPFFFLLNLKDFPRKIMRSASTCMQCFWTNLPL